MKKLFLWMLALTMVLGLTSCSADDDETPVDQRTVIVYMSGDNSLSPVESLDILEMQDGASGIPQNSNLVVFIDRDVMGENPFIIRIKTDYKVDTLYKYTSDFYASDPEKFSEVLKRITTLCPAKEYGLVLWGHGSGWVVDSDTIAQKRAYGVDHNKWMNITQMTSALKDLKNQNVLPKLSYIFADCCNMVNAETGYEFRELTDYLIGSPCEIPGYGAPYQLVVPHLFRSGSALYKGIIDTYYDYYTDFDHLTGVEKITWPYMKDGYSVPLSVIDTKYISDLADMTHDMLEHTIGGYPLYPESPDLEDIAFYWYGDVRMMYDMRAVMERLLSEDDFKTWDKTYQLAVPYYRMSMKWMTIWALLKNTFSSFNPDLKYGCVSMFIPKEGSYYTYGKVPYNITSLNFGWNRVMDWKRFGWE